MKVIFTTVLLLFSAKVVFSEVDSYDHYFSQEATIKILVDDMSVVNDSLKKIIKDNGLIINSMKIDNQKHKSDYVFFVENSKFEQSIKELEAFGKIDAKKVTTKNNIRPLEENDYDQEFLENQKEIYEKELLEKDRNSEGYDSLWDKKQEITKTLYDINRDKLKLISEVENSVIILEVEEISAQYFEEDEDKFFDFINMPGIETMVLVLENPDKQLSDDKYVGGALKYMVTKGKTFFTIGVLKPLDSDDSGIDSRVNDIVVYSLGKDFYPRYLGRGKRTFFNPYSGFQIGGMVITSDKEINHFFTIEPHVGLEIYKNRYVIFDMRAGYLFPMDENRAKDFRGFTQSISFNIVF